MMRKNTKTRLAKGIASGCIVVLILYATSHSKAAPLIIDPDRNNPPGVQTSDDSSRGYEFQLHRPIQVNALGLYDYMQDGLPATQTVGLWNASGDLLGRASLSTADSLSGLFRYESLAVPVVLSAGQNYILAALNPDGISEIQRRPDHARDYPILDPVATIVGGRSTSGRGGFAFPNYHSPVFVGPTLDFITIPEPAGFLHLAGMVAIFLSGPSTLTRRRARNSVQWNCSRHDA
jgi:hypothetical protein